MGWHHQRITSSQSFTAPADLLWVSGCAGGCGGGGGHPAPGGGGGGGAAGECTCFFPLACTIGETLTLTIGSYGAGGSPGNAGTAGGVTKIERSETPILWLNNGGGGSAGSNPNGGHAGYAPGSGGVQPAGGSGAGANVYQAYGIDMSSVFGSVAGCYGRWSAASPGGALNFNGGNVWGVIRSNVFISGSGGANGGGGGFGGHSQFGDAGIGGSNGAPGANATGYGAGGGGGSGNSAGGNGSPGFLDIFWSTSAEDGAAMILTSAYDAAKTAASQSSVNAIPTTPLLAANYTAPDNASIATIKEKVNSIQVDAEGNVSADITRILGADISGDGSIGNPWGPE